MLCAFFFVIPYVSFLLCHSSYCFYSLMFTIIATSIALLFSFNIFLQVILLFVITTSSITPFFFSSIFFILLFIVVVNSIMLVFIFKHVLHFVASTPSCKLLCPLEVLMPSSNMYIVELLQVLIVLDYKVLFTFIPFLYSLQGSYFMPLPKYFLSFWVQSYEFFLETRTSFT